MNGAWGTEYGAEVAGTGRSGDRIWLRAEADIRPGRAARPRFSYSTDGVEFTRHPLSALTA